MKASGKQVRYLLALLEQCGYSTDWMNASFKALGARMNERSGRVIDWVMCMSPGRASKVIGQLKAQTEERTNAIKTEE